MRYVIGIDPGLDGAVAVLKGAKLVRLLDTPIIEAGKKRQLVTTAMRKMLLPYIDDDVIVALERVHSMPKQGVASSFRFGQGLGIWEGLVVGLGYRLEWVTPQAWKKRMMDGMPKDKGASIVRALQIFPDADLSLKKHHGRADALLIAEYAWRTAAGGFDG